MLARKILRDIAARRVRAALTLLGVVIGVAGLVAIVTTAQGFARAQRALFLSGARADLSIFLYDAPEAVLRGVARVPGVLAADLRTNVYGRGRLGADQATADLHFLGLRRFVGSETERLALVQGAWPGAGEALIEPAAAARYGLSVGATVFYLSATGRERPLRVSGVARLPAALSADITGLPLVFVPATVTQDLLGLAGYNELVVRLAPDVPRTEVATALADLLRRRSIPQAEPRFSDPQNFVGKRELDALFLVLYLFGALGAGLSGFLVANTLAALVVESTREIGILKALGATRRQVLGSVLLAALLYGALGTVLGLALGSVGGWALFQVLGRVASLDAAFRPEPLALALGSAVGLLVTLAGGAVPAWQAANLSAKQALESQGVSRRFGTSRLDRWAQRLTGGARGSSWELVGARTNSREQETHHSSTSNLQSPVSPSPPLPLSPSPLVAMGARNLLRRKGRSGVTVAVVALAVAALLAAQSTDQSVDAALRDIAGTYYADAYLQFEAGADATSTGNLRRVAGVARAEGWLLRSCSAAFTRTRCWAMPPDTTLYRPALVAGAWLDARDPLGVVLSADLARAGGLAPGDRFLLRLRDAEREVTVRGVVVDNAIFLGSDVQSKVFVPRDTLAALAGQAGAADLFALDLHPPTALAQQGIMDEVDRKLAALRPSSTLALTELETSREQTRILSAALRGMVLLVAIVGAVGLVNTLALNVLERRREIGVLRALGTDNQQMLTLFVTEGLALGLLGWAAGLTAGWLLGRGFVAALSTALFTLPFHFPPALVGTSLGFALALALIASVAPALAAAGMPTAEAIRYE